MKIVIDEINVEEEDRIRKDSGDIELLQSSIEEVGLLNPVLVDENKKLIAGYRRLTACKNLGWQEIEATIIEFKGDRMMMLDIEVAENLYRKDFTREELFAVEQKRQEIIESLRKKSILERFWLWLKGLFSIKEQETPSPELEEEVKSDDLVGEPSVESDDFAQETSVKNDIGKKDIDIFSTEADDVIDPYRK